MNETQPRPLYDVIKRETELGRFDDGERINAEPLGLVDAIQMAAEVVDHYSVKLNSSDRYCLDCITTSGTRQRWHLHHERYHERKLAVDVVEVKVVAS